MLGAETNATNGRTICNMMTYISWADKKISGGDGKVVFSILRSFGIGGNRVRIYRRFVVTMVEEAEAILKKVFLQ